MPRSVPTEALFVFALRLATSSVLEPGTGGMPLSFMLDENIFSIKSSQKFGSPIALLLGDETLH